MENKVTSHIVKGAILSAFGILISIIVTVFNLYEVSWINYINYAITIGGLIYSCIMYANENNNNVTFGNIFAHGFKTTSVIIVITVLYVFLSLKVLFPEMPEKILDIARKKMAENPQMTDEMIVFTPNQIVQDQPCNLIQTGIFNTLFDTEHLTFDASIGKFKIK